MLYLSFAWVLRSWGQRILASPSSFDDRSLWSALRSAGIGDPREAALVVLEPHGQFSVLRSGSPIHASALVGVRRGGRALERLVQAGLAVPGERANPSSRADLGSSGYGRTSPVR